MRARSGSRSRRSIRCWISAVTLRASAPAPAQRRRGVVAHLAGGRRGSARSRARAAACRSDLGRECPRGAARARRAPRRNACASPRARRACPRSSSSSRGSSDAALAGARERAPRPSPIASQRRPRSASPGSRGPRAVSARRSSTALEGRLEERRGVPPRARGEPARARGVRARAARRAEKRGHSSAFERLLRDSEGHGVGSAGVRAPAESGCSSGGPEAETTGMMRGSSRPPRQSSKRPARPRPLERRGRSLRAIHERGPQCAARRSAACCRDRVEAVDVLVVVLGGGGRWFNVGAGTSGRMGALDAAEIPPTFGLPPGRVQALIAGGERALLARGRGRRGRPRGARSSSCASAGSRPATPSSRSPPAVTRPTRSGASRSRTRSARARSRSPAIAARRWRKPPRSRSCRRSVPR